MVSRKMRVAVLCLGESLEREIKVEREGRAGEKRARIIHCLFLCDRAPPVLFLFFFFRLSTFATPQQASPRLASLNPSPQSAGT